MIGIIIAGIAIRQLLGVTAKEEINAILPGSFPEEEQRKIQRYQDKKRAVKTLSKNQSYDQVKDTPQEIDWLIKNEPLLNYVNEIAPESYQRKVRAEEIALRQQQEKMLAEWKKKKALLK